MSLLKIKNICYSYDGRKNVLKDISYEFEAGNIYAIVGKSGAGKTTMLSLLSGLAEPTAGKIYYKEENIAKMNKYDFRSKCVGIIFQNFNLLSKLTAVENVILSMEISGKREKNKKQQAYELLEKVGLDRDEADRRILKLSGGQQQRVAIARALSYDPDIILADEPTGNLDPKNSWEIMRLLEEVNRRGTTVVVVTHNREIVDMMQKRVITLRNGHLISDEQKGGYAYAKN